MNKREAKRFALYVVACDLWIGRIGELAAFAESGNDEEKLHAALSEVVEELLRRSGASGTSLTPRPADIGIATPIRGER